jgi:hypothetical protein
VRRSWYHRTTLSITLGHDSDIFKWHSDIKPENILEIQGEFKLADPGFDKFLEKVKRPDSDLMANLSGGTHTFGT